MKNCKRIGIYVLFLLLLSGFTVFAAEEVSFYAGMGEPGFRMVLLRNRSLINPMGLPLTITGIFLLPILITIGSEKSPVTK